MGGFFLNHCLLLDYIPSAIMIPQRRFSTLLHQARLYQRQRCVYHNLPMNSSSFSLYSDHRCNKSDFPRITTTILEVHKDEVWNIKWSHDGAFLASASKDKSAIIWRRGVSVLCYSGTMEMKLMIMFYFESHHLIPIHRHHKTGLHIMSCAITRTR
jgi:WD domain, G-beta repeat